MQRIKHTNLVTSFVSSVIHPRFENYTFVGNATDEDTGEVNTNYSVHLINVGVESFLCTYIVKDDIGYLDVFNVNRRADIIRAEFNVERCSWVTECAMSEELLHSDVVHACQVLKRLHEVSLNNK